MPAAKKRNPNDATLRNIRALKARVSKLEATVAKLTKPQPRDPRDDAYWRKLAQVIGKAHAIHYKRCTGQIR